MKLIKTIVPEQSEVEVEIRYSEMDTSVAKLIKHIEQYEHCIHGVDNGRHYKIQIRDIYYIESVDKKTFIYTETSVFCSELRLYRLYEMLKDLDFVQVSKSCLINTNILESIRTLFNSRLEATLINGERLHVSRTYLTTIKDAFATMEEIE